MHLDRLPCRGIDLAAAPAAFDHEGRRRLGVERGHEIVGVPAERDADAIFLRQCDVVALADIVERKQLHHQMMHAVPAGLDQREAVMPRVDMEEVGAKRLFDVVGKSEAEHVDIERHHGFDVLDRQHGVPEAERAGAKARDRTSRHERRVVDLGAMKRFQPVAGGIAKRDQAADAPCVGQRLRLGRDLHAGLFQPGRQRIKRGAVCDLPAEEARPFAHRAVDDDALLAVIHPERQQRIAALHRLQPDEAGPELPPVLEVGRSEPGISQTQQCHRLPPSFANLCALNAPLLGQILRNFCPLSTPKDGLPD